MKLPDAILDKILARFASLIDEGHNIINSGEEVPPKFRTNDFTGDMYQSSGGYKKIDAERFIEWRTKAATLLSLVVPRDHIHWPAVEQITRQAISCDLLKSAISLLRGIRDDLDKGFLDDMATAIEAEIACDYMGQAEALLAEGHNGKLSHVPAAVLAGAVLEKGLRTLCSQQESPISQKDPRGTHKTLGPLIDELKKAGVFNEAKAKQLRAWASIRNLAAHGEFAQFTRSDVETMIPGVNNFLADYLK